MSRSRSGFILASPRPAAWILALAIAVQVSGPAHADEHAAANGQDAAVAHPSDAPVGARQISPSFPKTVDQAKAEAEAAKKPPETWSDAEITEAKAHCAIVLQRIHAVAIAHEPIKEGACGAPAPIELVSIGKNPEVALSPPAIVRCDLAETLVTWLEHDLQPLARKYLKSPIIKMETMSSYSCRNAYGRKWTKLSEHGLANAVDIGGFVTASAKSAFVLADWGTPQREILERVAAEKAAAEARIAAAAKAGDTKASGGIIPPVVAAVPEGGGPGTTLARTTIIDGMPKPPAGTPVTKQAMAALPRTAGPDRLGGPVPRPHKSETSSDKVLIAVAKGGDDGGGQLSGARAFLHEAHTAACRIFGTTLGPEANADHRNHFHVDMAPRAISKICD